MGGRQEGETTDDVAPAPGAHPAQPRRRWLRRLGLALVAILALVPVGLQVQVASEQREAERREADQHRAERDEQAASNRLASVDSRALTARADEAAAQAELDRARADMAAKGLEESSLGQVQEETGSLLDVLRDQGVALAAALAEQERLQPAAESCLFDLLRTLGRGIAEDRGSPTEACATAAGHSPVPG